VHDLGWAGTARNIDAPKGIMSPAALRTKHTDVFNLHAERSIGLDNDAIRAAKAADYVVHCIDKVHLQRLENVGRNTPADLTFTRSISTCTCGALVWKLANMSVSSQGLCRFGHDLILRLSYCFKNAQGSASSICSLKPPIEPRPGTGGGGNMPTSHP
jgi:hypothetical protein